MKYKIPFILPSFPSPDDISKDIAKIISSNWYTNFGPYENKLRQKVIEFIDQDIDVCTVSNATSALDVAVKALFTQSSVKNKVIIPGFTFAAGGNVVLMNNFEPVFIDINKQWQPSISQAKDYLSKHQERVAGIILCNIFGVGNSHIKEWEDLAKEHKVPIIIDSAAGFGSEYESGEKLGGRGDCEIFSLHATKPFSVGEGGMITSTDKLFISKCRSLTNFGFDTDRKISMVGTNAKLNEISCSIGILQLADLSEKLNKRREAYNIYRTNLENLGFDFQTNSDRSTVAFVSVLAPTVVVANKTLKALADNAIEAKQYYDPLTRHPIFKEFSKGGYSLNNTEDISDRIVCLPLHDNMKDSTIREIVSVIRGAGS